MKAARLGTSPGGLFFEPAITPPCSHSELQRLGVTKKEGLELELEAPELLIATEKRLGMAEGLLESASAPARGKSKARSRRSSTR